MLINNAVITGSLTVNGTDVTYITGSSQISSSFLALSSSYLITSASYVVTSGSYAITSASFAQTSGSLSIRTGNLEATSSTLTSASSSFAAQSASLSTRLTTDETNITTLTNASASFAVVSSSFSSTSGSLSTRVTNLEATSSTVSSSFASTSGSIAGRVTLIEGQYATTGSNTFTGVQSISSTVNAQGFTTSASLYTDGGARITKDLFVSGTTYLTNLTVYGTASVQYITSSQINVGANIIYLNTQTPAVRYGGMAVADSGSNAGVTGSMLWDSVNNGWIYTRESGSTYSGGALISGPRSSVQGSEQGTTNNALMKGQGGDHITSSQMIDDGTTVQIPGNLQVTGSLVNTGAATFSSGDVSVIGSGLYPRLTIQSTNVGSSAAGINFADNSATQWAIAYDKTGAGMQFFREGVGNRMYLTNSGNLGLGVTPSAWATGYIALQIPSGTYGGGSFLSDNGSPAISANAYNNAGWKYVNTDFATIYQSRSGQHQWFNAPSGTAGNAITFTQAMTLNDSGRLALGGTTITDNSLLNIQGSTVNHTIGIILNKTNATAQVYGILNQGPLDIYNYTSSSYMMRINASGNLSIGNTNDTYKLDVNGTGRFTGQVNSETAFYAVATPPATNGGLINVRDTVTATNVTSFAGVFFNSSPGNDYSIGKLTENNSGFLQIRNANNGAELLRINSTGAATFSSSVLTNSEYDVNASGGIGGFTGFKLRYGSASVQSLTMGQATAGNGAWIGMAQYRAGGYWQTEGTAAAVLQFEGDGTFKINTNSGLTANTDYNVTPRLTIANTGIATFSSSVTAQNMYSVSDNSEQITIKTATDNNKQLIFGRTNTEAKIIAVTQGVGYVPLCLNPSGGNVGIGTDSPGAKLTVNGLAWINRPSNKVDNNTAIEFGGKVEFNNSFVAGQSGYVVMYYPTYNNFRILGDYDGNIGGIQPNIQIGNGTIPAIHIQNSGGNTGNVGIGTVSPSAKLQVESTIATASAPTVFLNQYDAGSQNYANIATGDQYHGLILRGYPAAYNTYGVTTGNYMSFYEYGGDFRFYKKDTSSLVLQGYLNNGTWTVTGDVVAYGSPSDISLKTNIKPLEGALDKITKLQGVSFTWKEDTDASKMTGIKDDIGFIAQEVQEILPDLVRKNDNGLLSLRDKGITALLVEAIKEQQLQIEELKTLIHGLTK